MRVVRLRDRTSHSVSFALLDDAGQPVRAIAGFLGHLSVRGCSPNTLSAYAHDLLHFERFLRQRGLAHADFTPVEAVVF
jgi:site-specific recombinase XerD